jgi:glutaredoxin-like protein
MLKYVNPKARKPDQVAILTREGCSFCAKAKKRLAEAGYDYVEVPLPHTIRTKAVGAIAGAQTVPQVFVNGRLIGGNNELEAFLLRRAA